MSVPARSRNDDNRDPARYRFVVQPADDYQEICDDLFFWQEYDPAVKTDLSSCAIRVAGRLVFIDPIPLAPESLELLKMEAAPAAIILTSGNHERAAAVYKKEFAIPIYAHSEARGELAADHWIEDGATLFDELTAVQIPGAGPGEIAIHSPARGGVMVIGDALINLDPYGFTFLPDKYCANAKTMRKSLRKLLQFPFEVLTFAHGLPIVSSARNRLVQLLDS